MHDDADELWSASALSVLSCFLSGLCLAHGLCLQVRLHDFEVALLGGCATTHCTCATAWF
jgi:hypothetical protein